MYSSVISSRELLPNCIMWLCVLIRVCRRRGFWDTFKLSLTVSVEQCRVWCHLAEECTRFTSQQVAAIFWRYLRPSLVFFSVWVWIWSHDLDVAIRCASHCTVGATKCMCVYVCVCTPSKADSDFFATGERPEKFLPTFIKKKITNVCYPLANKPTIIFFYFSSFLLLNISIHQCMVERN